MEPSYEQLRYVRRQTMAPQTIFQPFKGFTSNIFEKSLQLIDLLIELCESLVVL